MLITNMILFLKYGVGIISNGLLRLGFPQCVAQLSYWANYFGKSDYSVLLADKIYQKGYSETAIELMEKIIKIIFLKNYWNSSHSFIPSNKNNKVLLFAVSHKTTLHRFMQACSGSDLKPFLAFGSLLGYVREKDFVKWDKDLDIGFIYDNLVIQTLIDCLVEHGFLISVNTGNIFPCRLKCHLPGSPLVDITFFKKSGNSFITYGELMGEKIFRKRSQFELKKVSYTGIDVYVPDYAEHFLRENYGSWQNPQPIYHYVLDSKLTDYQNQLITFYSRRHFFRMLVLKDIVKIKHYLKLFLERAPSDPFWKELLPLFNQIKSK